MDSVIGHIVLCFSFSSVSITHSSVLSMINGLLCCRKNTVKAVPQASRAAVWKSSKVPEVNTNCRESSWSLCILFASSMKRVQCSVSWRAGADFAFRRAFAYLDRGVSMFPVFVVLIVGGGHFKNKLGIKMNFVI